MLAIRVKFKKEGRAKYISHLDLNRCMQRALRRAQIPIWRTQGFNPHPYIVFAMPLSIFFESDCEIMDARLDGEMSLDEVKQRLQAQMPEGIVITDVTEPRMKIADIAFAAYSVTLDFENQTQKELAEVLSGLTARDEIVIEKESKRKTVELDVKEYFMAARMEALEGQIKLEVTLPAGSQYNLNPSCLIAAFSKYSAQPDFQQIRRLRIYNKDMQEFL